LARTAKRFPLKPLSRRRRSAANAKAIASALERLDGRAMGEDLLEVVKKTISKSQGNQSQSRDKDERAKNMVTLIQALHASRRITDQEYVFYGSSTIEGINDDRWLTGQYDDELGEIAASMESIEKEAGLKANEYWLKGDAPAEHRKLSEKYSAILEARLVATLDEFGLNDLAKLREDHEEEFDRLRERGRRSVFHKGNDSAALRDIVLGAGLEGLLFLRCLRSKAKASRVARSLPRRKQPRSPNDPATWTFENLIQVCMAAGWLPPVSTEVATYNPAGLAHLLRTMRNHIHPGRRVRERPWLEAEVGEYKDAEAIYVTLLATLPSKVRKKKTSGGGG
jgi:hypothetical protein